MKFYEYNDEKFGNARLYFKSKKEFIDAVRNCGYSISNTDLTCLIEHDTKTFVFDASNRNLVTDFLDQFGFKYCEWTDVYDCDSHAAPQFHKKLYRFFDPEKNLYLSVCKCCYDYLRSCDKTSNRR